MMFNDSKYTRWYFSIIDRARLYDRSKGYFEKHHIVPHSMGGDDSTKNIVRLTPREHFICHMLLIKMTSGKSLYKMAFAAHMMAKTKKYGKSKSYSTLRELASNAQKQFYIDNPEERQKIRVIWNKWNSSATQEERISRALKISAAAIKHWEKLRHDNVLMEKHKAKLKTGQAKRKPFPEEHRKNISFSNGFKGAKYTIQDPSGNIYSPLNFAAFCIEHGINHKILKQSFHNGFHAVMKGPSVGWTIKEIK